MVATKLEKVKPKRKCAFPGCDVSSHSSSLCYFHDWQWQKGAIEHPYKQGKQHRAFREVEPAVRIYLDEIAKGDRPSLIGRHSVWDRLT